MKTKNKQFPCSQCLGPSRMHMAFIRLHRVLAQSMCPILSSQTRAVPSNSTYVWGSTFPIITYKLIKKKKNQNKRQNQQK